MRKTNELKNNSKRIQSIPALLMSRLGTAHETRVCKKVKNHLEKQERELKMQILSAPSTKEAQNSIHKYNQFIADLRNIGLDTTLINLELKLTGDTKQVIEKCGADIHGKLLKVNQENENEIDKIISDRNKYRESLVGAGLKLIELSPTGIVHVGIEKSIRRR